MKKIIISELVDKVDGILNGEISGVQMSKIDWDVPVGAQAGTNINVVGTPTVHADFNKTKGLQFTFNYLKGVQGSIGKQGFPGGTGSQGVLGQQGYPGLNTPNVARTDTKNTFNSTCTFKEYCVFDEGAGTSSDIRFKKNVKPIDNVLNDVVNLDLINYTWEKDNEPKIESIGVIAQQIETINPDFEKIVHMTNDEYQTRTVDYSKLSVFALKAIQEQQIIINDLIKRIEKLENK